MYSERAVEKMLFRLLNDSKWLFHDIFDYDFEKEKRKLV